MAGIGESIQRKAGVSFSFAAKQRADVKESQRPFEPVSSLIMKPQFLETPNEIQ